MDGIRDKKVLVAMSGGLDSSVAAALLKKRGFSVAGAFMKFWSPPTDDELSEGFNRCCSSESEFRARSIAEMLGIPFYVIDFKKEFKEMVVDSFIQEYRNGRTPNPCVQCNKEIKIGLLIKKAVMMGFDFLATGHYAAITNGTIHRAKDKKKDQSYFLWMLQREEIGRLIFPLAEYYKEEIRGMVDGLGLSLSGISEIKESMEVCFISDTLEKFLSDYFEKKQGEIIDEKGKIVGRHSGLWLYTIGQRKGLGLSGGPYFVIGKNQLRNHLLISKNPADLEKAFFRIENVNWILDEPKSPFKAEVQIRYSHKASPATINLNNNIVEICFDKPQKAITSGQSAVIYNGDELIGGGVIS